MSWANHMSPIRKNLLTYSESGRRRAGDQDGGVYLPAVVGHVLRLLPQGPEHLPDRHRGRQHSQVLVLVLGAVHRELLRPLGPALPDPVVAVRAQPVSVGERGLD
eukprot:4824144-Pyramimonas_sp.AAC.1